MQYSAKEASDIVSQASESPNQFLIYYIKEIQKKASGHLVAGIRKSNLVNESFS